MSPRIVRPKAMTAATGRRHRSSAAKGHARHDCTKQAKA
jgi:hypothetical protein